jgi:hypothetical protein
MAGYSGGLWHSRILLPGLHTFRTFTAVLSRIAVCSFRRESGTCMPPFFRTSAGHRVEGRNPWHLQCSRNQLHAGTQFRRLVRSLSLQPSWLLASWADQTKPRLSLPKASTSGLPVPKSPRGLPDITTAPNGELRRQDFPLQVQQLVSLRSLLRAVHVMCAAGFVTRGTLAPQTTCSPGRRRGRQAPNPVCALRRLEKHRGERPPLQHGSPREPG